LVVLLPNDDGRTGEVVIGEGGRRTSLAAPLAAAKINAQGRVKHDMLPEQEVRQTFAQALAAQPPKPVSFLLYFVENSTEIVPESRAALQELFAEVARHQAVEVQITGHTDRVGTVADNDRLSIERAEAIRSALLQRGLRASFVRAVGRGERQPLIPTPDEQPEPRNRRVEVLVR
jgi:outer membrane protein OmpA-like peptidoglycan-associated protein